MNRSSSITSISDDQSDFLNSNFSKKLDEYVKSSLRGMYNYRYDKVEDQIEAALTTISNVDRNVRKMHKELRSKVQNYGEFTLRHFQHMVEQISLNHIKRKSGISSRNKLREYLTHPKARVKKSESKGKVFFKVSFPGMLIEPGPPKTARTTTVRSQEYKKDNAMEHKYVVKQEPKTYRSSLTIPVTKYSEPSNKSQRVSRTESKSKPTGRSSDKSQTSSETKTYTSTLTIPDSRNKGHNSSEPAAAKPEHKTHRSSVTISISNNTEQSPARTSHPKVQPTKPDPSNQTPNTSTATVKPTDKEPEQSKPTRYTSTATIVLADPADKPQYTSTLTIPASGTSKGPTEESQSLNTSKALGKTTNEPTSYSQPKEQLKTEPDPSKPTRYTSTASIVFAQQPKPKASSRTSTVIPSSETSKGPGQRTSQSQPNRNSSQQDTPRTYTTEMTITLANNKNTKRNPPREAGGKDSKCCLNKPASRVSKSYKETDILKRPKLQRIIAKDYKKILDKFPATYNPSHK